MPPARFRRSALACASAEAEGDDTMRPVNKTLVQIIDLSTDTAAPFEQRSAVARSRQHSIEGRRRAAWTTAKSFSSIRMRS
jgi:hypothetical protein